MDEPAARFGVHVAFYIEENSQGKIEYIKAYNDHYCSRIRENSIKNDITKRLEYIAYREEAGNIGKPYRQGIERIKDA